MWYTWINLYLYGAFLLFLLFVLFFSFTFFSVLDFSITFNTFLFFYEIYHIYHVVVHLINFQMVEVYWVIVFFVYFSCTRAPFSFNEIIIHKRYLILSNHQFVNYRLGLFFFCQALLVLGSKPVMESVSRSRIRFLCRFCLLFVLYFTLRSSFHIL